jgi:hypothetical protein
MLLHVVNMKEMPEPRASKAPHLRGSILATTQDGLSIWRKAACHASTFQIEKSIQASCRCRVNSQVIARDANDRQDIRRERARHDIIAAVEIAEKLTCSSVPQFHHSSAAFLAAAQNSGTIGGERTEAEGTFNTW